MLYCEMNCFTLRLTESD